MSETVTQTEVEAATVQFDGKSFNITDKTVPGRKSSKNPNPPDRSWLVPALESAEDWGTFLTSLLNEAEQRASGSALKLVDKIFEDFFQDVSQACIDASGAVHEDKIVAAFTAVGGKGLTIREIDAQLAALNAEFQELYEIVEKKGTPEFFTALSEKGLTEVTFAQRGQALKNRSKDLNGERQVIMAKTAARQKTKNENAAKKAKEAGAAKA